jgi:hypothetical protein
MDTHKEVEKMRITTTYISLCLCLIPCYSYGLTMEPDSIVMEIEPLMVYHEPVETLTISNQSDTDVTVDSITIHLLDGDSLDFSMGIDCQPGQFSEYNYRGWVYGTSNKSLRYCRDSLFLLQDSSGNPVTFTIALNGSIEFPVWLIVNCPVCGRMPSFPATEHYLYLFHTSGGDPDSLKVTIRDSGSTTVITTPTGKSGNRVVKKDKYNLAGQKLNTKNAKRSGIILGEKSKRIRIDER